MLDYELDQTVVKTAEANPALFQHLLPIYDNITRPMEARLKSLVIEMNLCSEAEIFASQLKFKVFQKKSMNEIYQLTEKRRGNAHDEKEKLKARLKEIKKVYMGVFKAYFNKIKLREAARRRF